MSAPSVDRGRALVDLDDAERFCREAFEASGVPTPAAVTVACIYRMETARAVGHHALDALPLRLQGLASGQVDGVAEPIVVGGSGAVTRLDGRNGLGELCAWVTMERAIASARTFGVGFATIARSNHFLAAAPYVQHAAEQGLVALVLARTVPSMGTPGAGKMVLGNNPVGFAAPTADDVPLAFDFSLSYASMGALNQMAARGTSIPPHWATAPTGSPTTDAAEAIKGGPEPIGGHKGAALSLMVEVLTAVLAGGAVVDEGIRDGQRYGVEAHAAIVIDPAVLGSPDPAARTTDVLRRVGELAPADFRPPGLRSAQAASASAAAGAPVSNRILDSCDAWAERLAIRPLTRSGS